MRGCCPEVDRAQFSRRALSASALPCLAWGETAAANDASYQVSLPIKHRRTGCRLHHLLSGDGK
jgi:hypothetical protein